MLIFLFVLVLMMQSGEHDLVANIVPNFRLPMFVSIMGLKYFCLQEIVLCLKDITVEEQDVLMAVWWCGGVTWRLW